jgi:phospholipid/cholesterol/gamma-HCH transport system permease protein
MAAQTNPSLTLKDAPHGLSVSLAGDWTTTHAAKLSQLIADVKRSGEATRAGKALEIDLSNVAQFDTAGAWHVARLRDFAAAQGATFEMTGKLAKSQLLQRVLATAAPVPDEPIHRGNLFGRLFEKIGVTANAAGKDVLLSMDILGSVVRGSQLKANRKSGFSLTPVVAHIDRMGVGAVPIVILMATIIGAIIAQQGAFQLRYFGAEIYVVDLVGILVFREIGVLITAIMVAGRTGSAITAEIGSMKMREEVDALTVIGLNPVSVLVFPRLVALVIALPLLTVIANIAALGGAAVVASLYSGISFESFVSRLREAIDLSSVMAGLIKAPFMALIIGIIAAAEGLKVQGSAESLGLCVTRSVVKSIFVVIVVDGLFAIFYAQINF